MPLHICIISPDEAFAESLGSSLAGAGHNVSCIVKVQELKDLPQQELFIVELEAEGQLAAVARLQKTKEARHVPLIALSSCPEFEYELANVFDFILKPLNIQRLNDDIEMILRGIRRPLRPSPDQFREADYRLFYDYLISRSGLRFDPRNVKFLSRGIRSRMQVLHIESYQEYFDYLTRYQESRQELQKLLQLLTVGETYFFRYRAHFDVLTRLMRKEFAVDPARRLRFWSAGCSTGEEPYSLAMTIMDAIPDWRKRDITVFASDLNKRSLKKATEGRYRPWVMRAMEQRHVRRYFDFDGETYLIKDEVKELVRFSHLNLQTATFPSPGRGLADLDAIFCRNVLIYFDLEAIKRIVDKLAAALKPGGYLFLGHAEMLTLLSSRFERYSYAGGFYYRKKSGLASVTPPRERRVIREPRKAVESSATIKVREPASAENGHEPDVESLYRQAQDLFHLEDFAGASQLLEEIIRRRPDHVGALVAQGFIQANKGLLEDSLEMCGKALAMDDLLPDAYFLKGLVLEMIDQPTEAVAEYRKAILLNMEFLMPHYYLGRLFLRIGRKREGTRELRTCLRILERGTEGSAVPYAGGLTRDSLLGQLRRELPEHED